MLGLFPQRSPFPPNSTNIKDLILHSLHTSIKSSVEFQGQGPVTLLTYEDVTLQLLLEVALSSRAKAIVTGNKRHFPKKEYEEVSILSPAEFLEAVKEKI